MIVNARKGRALVLLAASLTVATSCRGYRTAVELDKVAKSIDRYGFASISAPFLAAPSEVFSFDLNKSADYFFERANSPQGAVRNFSAQAVDAQLAIRINVEQALATIAQFQRAGTIAEFREAQRQAKVQAALLKPLIEGASAGQVAAEAAGVQALSAAVPEAATHATQTTEAVQAARSAQLEAIQGMLDAIANQPEPDPEALPGFQPTTQPVETKPPFSTADRVALGAVGSTFTPGLSMPGGPFQISARDALLISSGDVMTQSLFRWFMHPQGNKLKNYELYFCPIVVSVQPGYETRGEYQADVTVNVDLAKRNPGLKDLAYLSDGYGQSTPPIQIAGVFPVLDAQVMDLANSRRRLYSMAFQLSTLGFGSQANFFLDFARKLEQDTQTRTALTAASAYTIGSTSFGFRVEPKSVAVRNVGELDSEPGDFLESKTFPAMAVLLVHRSYLPHWDDVKGDNGRLEHRKLDENLYPFLVFRTSVRWTPVDKKSFLPSKRYSEVDLWRRAKALDEAEAWHKGNYAFGGGDRFDDFISLDHMKSIPATHQDALLDSRLRTLSKIAVDSRALVRVYHTAPRNQVCVVDVSPSRGWLDQATYITLRGYGFKGNVESVTVGGILCDYDVLSDDAMIIAVPPWGAKKPDQKSAVGELSEYVALTQDPFDNLNKLVQRMESSSMTDGERESLRKAIKAALDETKRLSPEEQKLLDGLTQLAAACKLNPKDLKWEDFKDLLERSRISAVHDRQKAKEAAKKKAEQAEITRWAQIVIGTRADAPVCIDCDQLPCTPFPDANPPELTNNVKLNPFFSGVAKKGWILFDKKLPSSSKKPAKGTVEITRDKEGRITGIRTGDGGFPNGAQLLDIAKQALCCEDENCDCRVNVIPGGSGTVIVTHCSKCGLCSAKCTCKDEKDTDKDD